MKLWIISDLHLEFDNVALPPHVPDADVCVAAGDVHRGFKKAIGWLGTHIAPRMPVVYVGGNHEFYRGSIVDGLEEAKELASQYPGVHFLENNLVEIDGVRFVGATLWTDFRIQGHQELAMLYARNHMKDYRAIFWRKKPFIRLTPSDTVRVHSQSKSFLSAALATTFDGKTVVVTHHLPHMLSVPQRFQSDLLSAAFASDLSELIEESGPELWVHGHTHNSCDYRVGDTRIICNPKGYPDENPEFNATVVIEI
ncbi:metallophosphoesterase [Phyllobacterium sp. LjRoot231]|uniref:metallophosphoesterase n=1 Tax=Phyllobacterium sp. LjRoot231 TaxID=3342289 RepID=UPI003ECD97BA